VIAEHLPALQVVVPLMAAPLAIILRRPNAVWGLSLGVSWATFGIAISLLLQVLDSGAFSYAIGGWSAPWGIEYRIDPLATFLLVLVSAIASVVILFAKASVEKEIPSDRIYLFYAMYLLCLTGLLGIAITGDAFNLFVFLEISSLSTYVLISLGQDRRALSAAYRYLVMGTLGATFYIIGVGMMYMATGTLNIADLATRLPALMDSRTILSALAFLIAGISLKLALFPLHSWLPNAYAYAPSAVSAFVAATATKVAVYVLVRILFTIFGGAALFTSLPIGEVLMLLAVSGMFVGSVVAIYQSDLKRLLAYSSIAQIGYMVLGISLASVTGLTGGIIHLFNHALVKGALFMAAGCVFYRIGSSRIEDFTGLGRRMPVTMAAFVVAGLGLIGVPLTTGFVSKWYLVLASIEKGLWPLAVLILITSLLAIVYVWKVVEVAYFKPAPDNAETVAEAPLSMLAPLWIMTAASIYFGIDASRTLDVAATAARALLGVVQ
jgi:multicomponent Na+:H+ antiporter subunit D